MLDEISEMDLALQAKLLRVLQEGEVDRVGGTDTLSVDVRVLATTNRNLEEWVKEGKFRQDLFFRLNVIPLRLPSLRERENDVLTLAQFFMTNYSKEYGLSKSSLSATAVQWLKQYDFPGNVRELQNLMERATLLANGNPIEPGHFLLDPDAWPLFMEEPAMGADAGASQEGLVDMAQSGANSSVTLDAQGGLGMLEDTSAAQGGSQANGQASSQANSQANAVGISQSGGTSGADQLFGQAVIPLHEMERIMIMKGLESTSGNRTQAAELLGISVRTLRNKLNEYRAMGIEIE